MSNILCFFGHNTNEKEAINMECTCNQIIRCTVDKCKHHEAAKNLCSLEAITVGTHEANPTKIECTDCLSFEYK